MSWQEDSVLRGRCVFIMELPQFNDTSPSRLPRPPSSDSAPLWLPMQTVLQQRETAPSTHMILVPLVHWSSQKFMNSYAVGISLSTYNKSAPTLSLLKLVCNQKSICHWESGGNSIGIRVRKMRCQSRPCHFLVLSKLLHPMCLCFISHTWV